MAYRDTYNKMLKNKGGNSMNSTFNSTTSYIDRHFREDLTIRDGFMVKDNSPIDFRISNSVGSSSMDKNVDIKKMIFRSSCKITSGQYIKENTNYWLITEVENNLVNPKGIGYNCNNFLRIKSDNKILDIYAYFLKGTFSIKDTEFVKLSDNNLTVLVGTDYSDKITLLFNNGTRFLVNKKAYKIETIDDITQINKGLGVYLITLTNDEIKPEDDLDNGIAYNEDVSNPPTPTDIKIIGEDKISVGTDYEYVIRPYVYGYKFALDSYTTENNLATIVSQANGVCKIKANVKGEIIELIGKNGYVEIAKKTIITM